MAVRSSTIPNVSYRPPVNSFTRWARPILIGWALFCIPGGFAVDQLSLFSAGIPGAFPLYVTLYLIRLYVFLPNSENCKFKAACSILLLISFIPVWFLLSGVFTLSMTVAMMGMSELIREVIGQNMVSMIVSLLLFFLGIPIIVFSFVMILLERIVIGSTAGRYHLYGFAIGSVVAVVAMLVASLPIVSFVVLLLLPLPHLFFVWRGWLGRRPERQSRFNIRRAVAGTVAIAAAVYLAGTWRHLPEYGTATALAWPSVIRDVETRPEVDQARRSVLGAPGGRGALPIGDRTYLIPEAFDNSPYSNWRNWDETAGAYRSFEVTVPYEHWVDGFDPEAFHRWQDTRFLERATVHIQAQSTTPQPEEPVMCVRRQAFGLLRCFQQDDLERWAESWGLDVDALMPVDLPVPLIMPLLRGVIALEDRSLVDAAAVEDRWAIENQPFIAACDDAWRGEIDPNAISSLPDRANDCRVGFRLGATRARVLLSIDAQVLPYWREIRAGIAADLADWAAAAEGAERIDHVAERVAAALREERMSQPADVPPWCQIDRWLSVAFGVERDEGEMLSFSTPICRLPELLVEGRFPWSRPR